MVGLDARHRAEGGGGALRRQQRDRAADGDPEPARQPVADRDAVVAEIGERALDDVVRQQRERSQIVGPDPAHQCASRTALRGRHDLPFDDRGDPRDPRDLADFLRGGVEIGEAAAQRVDPEIAV